MQGYHLTVVALLWSPWFSVFYLCTLHLRGFSDAAHLNRLLGRWMGDLASLILRIWYISTINVPSWGEMVRKILWKARRICLVFSCDNLSSSAVCAGGIECSLKAEAQFMCLTRCWSWFKTFNTVFPCRVKGSRESTPGLAHSRSLTALSLHD